ncbi:uncharacterized protein [Aegilops tauschii subsp. strangulata]|uniref:uncharacterized protein n=1 Tax=Aegilops tauschii subsp. strangulata TaxID=200361 RepID=UPI003CC8B33C
MSQNKQGNVLCWNMRGINSETKQLAIRNAIDLSGCSVVCLQETKRASFDASFVKQFCPKNFDMFEFVPSVGNSDGLITVWMSSVFTGVPIFSESFALGVRLTSTQSNDSWTEDWLILGDFNFIRAPDNHYWIKQPGFFDVVQRSWAKRCYAPNAAAVLCKKLKTLRYDLKQWSRKISKLSMLIDNCNKTLLEIDGLEERRRLSAPETNFRVILKQHLLYLLDCQKAYWKKRCTVRYFKFGDGNTKFFHRVATERYRRNSIASLRLPDNSIIHDHVGKEAVLFQAFKERLGCSNQTNMKFDLPRIIKRVEGLQALSAPFTHEEIDKVVKEMLADRAPGPDGFSGSFIKSCWQIIKDDFYRLCSEFHAGTLDLESLNTGFITLIPKIQSPKTANDYRPITLLNCCLKILTKLLANRLQRVMLKIIHRNQYGFLKGRSIQDCVAWAYEFIHQCQASGREIAILKLDFAKAFDTIEHAPMMEIMKCMGFDDRWLGWIKCLFSTAKSSVLLNGTPGRQFFCLCGVRQGDPLSPLIFVLAADLLQAAINDAYRAGDLQLPMPAREGDYPVIQCADDTILVMPAEETQAKTIKSILQDYASSVGLRINFQKSTLITVNTAADTTSRLAQVFGCSIGAMPFTYLGLPMGTARPTVTDLMPLARDELDVLQTSLALLELTEVNDAWHTVWGSDELASSKFYLHCFRDMEADDVFKWIWKAKCTNKWKVFAWLLLADRLNTRGLLKRKHMKLRDDNYACLLCHHPPEETVEHLFFHCEFSKACWGKLGIAWPIHGNRVLTEKNSLLSQELEKCRTQLAVATAELEKSKEAPPGSLDQLNEALKVTQAGEQEAKRQMAAGDRVLTRVRDEKNKLRDSNTLLGEELKDVRVQLADSVKENKRLRGSIFSMLFKLASL